MQTAVTNNHDPYSHNRDGNGESHAINIITGINWFITNVVNTQLEL